jgi:hypothetical protein
VPPPQSIPVSLSVFFRSVQEGAMQRLLAALQPPLSQSLFSLQPVGAIRIHPAVLEKVTFATAWPAAHLFAVHAWARLEVEIWRRAGGRQAEPEGYESERAHDRADEATQHLSIVTETLGPPSNNEGPRGLREVAGIRLPTCPVRPRGAGPAGAGGFGSKRNGFSWPPSCHSVPSHGW